MQVYNTLSKSLEDFCPLQPGQIKFYVCGPTVYNDIHIGNARTFIVFDSIRRYLEFAGYEVTFVQNLTDIDDKIINAAHADQVEPAELALKFAHNFTDICKSLNIAPPSIQPKATQEIPEMIKLIEQLISTGHAYEANSSVYFSVRSWPQYGKLSGRDVDDLLSGARVEVDEVNKQDPLDFVLWKAAKPGEPKWSSPWGDGRPGWHIECSAMADKYLGTTFDIHAGGSDLIFPHHENELAQSCAAGGDPALFAKYWLHSGMLNINSAKMSKSEGNFLLAKDIVQKVDASALRVLMLQTHYRSTFDYSPERLEEATAAYERIKDAAERAQFIQKSLQETNGTVSSQVHSQIDTATANFKAEMEVDFNTPKAIAVIYQLVTELNTALDQLDKEAGTVKGLNQAELELYINTIVKLLNSLGIKLSADSSAPAIPETLLQPLFDKLGIRVNAGEAPLDTIIAYRNLARTNKDFALSDQIRDEMAALGLEFKDTPQGTQVSVIK